MIRFEIPYEILRSKSTLGFCDPAFEVDTDDKSHAYSACISSALLQTKQLITASTN
jgi:hypothetical protein